MSERSQTPIDLLRALSPAVARAYLEHKAGVMENRELAALPTKVKLLIGVGVAAVEHPCSVKPPPEEEPPSP